MHKLRLLIAASAAAMAAISVPSLAHASSLPHSASARAVTSSIHPQTGATWAICRAPGFGACLNVTQGKEATGTPIQMWAFSSSNAQERFVPNFIGQVSNGNSTPFYAGSGLNYKYNGSYIYQYIYEPNGTATSWCLGTDSSGGIVLEPCSSGNYFVTPGDGSSTTLIDVYETNLSHDGSPYYINNPVTTNGSPVYTGTSAEYWGYVDSTDLHAGGSANHLSHLTAKR